MKPRTELSDVLGPRLLQFELLPEDVDANPEEFRTKTAEFMGVTWGIRPHHDGGVALESTDERDQFFETENAAISAAYGEATCMLLNDVRAEPHYLTNEELAAIINQMAEDIGTLLRENAELCEEVQRLYRRSVL